MIGIDIDNTLYPFDALLKETFINLAREKGDKEYFAGAYAPHVEWRSPSDALGSEIFKEALSVTHSPSVILQQVPYKDSLKVVEQISTYHEILYISTRKEDAKESTIDWLNRWDFPNSSSLICSNEKIQYLENCQYIIDDRVKTLVEFLYDRGWPRSSPQRKAFGLLFDYNRNLTDVPNLYLAPSWNGIQYYLEDKGVLE